MFMLISTLEQAELLDKSFGCVRFVWNNTLAYRTEAYQQQSESMSHSAAEKRLVTLKAEYPVVERRVQRHFATNPAGSKSCVR